jgi:ABC-type transport system involved in multi-copper enzyme maturation permease subunit
MKAQANVKKSDSGKAETGAAGQAGAGKGVAKAGVVVDRGYQPYRGTLTPERGRWKVIARRALGMTARQPWVIVMLVLTVFPTLICGALMWLQTKMAAVAGPEAAQATAGAMSPDAMVYYLAVKPYGTLLLSFMIALFAGGSAVADDARAGAFQLYFARPVTREQYVVGKLVAAVSLTAMVTTAPALLLALFRLATAHSGGEVWQRLPGLVGALVLGLIEALALAAPALALSSLSKGRGYAQGAFAGLFLLPWVVGGIFVAVTSSGWPAIASLPAQFENIGRWLHRLPATPADHALPVWVSLAVVGAMVGGSITLLRRRLASVEVVAS